MRIVKTAQVPQEWRRQWPCSVLAGHLVTATYAPNGDLVDLEADTDTTDLEAAELEAALEVYGEQIDTAL